MIRRGFLAGLLALALPFAALAQIGAEGLSNLGAVALGDFQGPRSEPPTWSYDFRAGTLPAGSTFTRASTRTCLDASGSLVTLGNNVPCFYYDPATSQPWGYLSEIASTNGVVNSDAFDNASWAKIKASVTADTTAAPTGATTADTLTEDNTAGAHSVSQQPGIASNAVQGVSVIAKAGTRSALFLSIGFVTANQYATAVFNLSNGTVGETKVGSANGTIASTQIRSLGNGWYRVGLLARVTDTGLWMVIGTAPLASGNTFDTNGHVTYAGNGTGSVILSTAQRDTVGAGITSPIPTTGSTASRVGDLLALPLASLPGWDASKGGALVGTFRLHTNNGSTIDQEFAHMTDGANNMVGAETQSGGHGGSTSMGMLSRSGTIQINLTSPPVPLAFVRKRQGIGWGTARGQIAGDGAMAVTSSGVYLLPVGMTTLYLAGQPAEQLNGTLESIAYYAGERSDAFVQAATQQ